MLRREVNGFGNDNPDETIENDNSGDLWWYWWFHPGSHLPRLGAGLARHPAERNKIEMQNMLTGDVVTVTEAL